MKYSRLFLVLLSLCLLFLTGCRKLEQAADKAEDQIEAAADTAEQKVNDAANALLNPNPDVPASNHTPVDPSKLITAEHAQDIALLHAGVDQSEVTGLHTVLQIDDGRQEYEVEFQVGHLEYEYEIDAATGAVLSFDKDD